MYIYIVEEGRKVDLKNDLLISVAEEHMKDKKYNPQVSLVGYIKGFIDDSQLKVSKKELKKGLKEVTRLTYHKLNVVIEAYLQLQLLIEDGDYYIFNPIEAPFVGLQGETIRFCAEHMGVLDLKVYLYLMNKYQLNCIGKQNGRYTENYFFSKREIAVALGYAGNKESNIRSINRSLELLADTGLIVYSESKRRQGHNGYYHELYIVRQYSSTHLKADATYVKDRQLKGIELKEDDLNDLAAPIRNNIKLIEEAKSTRQILEETKRLLQ